MIKLIYLFNTFLFFFSILTTPYAEANLWVECAQYQSRAHQTNTFKPFPLLSSVFSLDVKQRLHEPISQSNLEIPLLSVPSDLAFLQDAYFPKDWKKSDPIVVHIQDIHDYYGAQKKILSLLNWIASHAKEKKVVVGIEGAHGAFDFEPYQTFPDRESAKKSVEALLEKTWISAPEYLGIIDKKDKWLFWGIEEKQAYLHHVEAFKKALPDQKNFSLKLQNLESILKQFQEKIYSSELKTFQEKQILYHHSKKLLDKNLENVGELDKLRNDRIDALYDLWKKIEKLIKIMMPENLSASTQNELDTFKNILLHTFMNAEDEKIKNQYEENKTIPTIFNSPVVSFFEENIKKIDALKENMAKVKIEEEEFYMNILKNLLVSFF